MSTEDRALEVLAHQYEIHEQVNPEAAYSSDDDAQNYRRAFGNRVMRALKEAGLVIGEGWQPIETAPKDKPLLLIQPPYLPSIGQWLAATHYQKERDGFEDCWLSDVEMSKDMQHQARIGNIEYLPTHWQPLPAPPEATK